ncbi:NUDIX hydrolase [Sunxiuqinia sp. sy24]|uniref:NUDIX hydrolase n=1 Tax=Sunxiuqinia sp. sy24 TaxID=3461495 RepID=UPI004045FF36
MYKVFFNEHQLLWGAEINNSPKDNIIQAVEIERFADFRELLLSLERSKHVVKLLIVSKQRLDLMEMLGENMALIPAAGGLVTKAERDYLFIRRLDKWDLPKGKIEEGESPAVAAIREVEEECGISGMTIDKKLSSTFHLYRSPYLPTENNWVLKETHWFKMDYTGSERLVPQVEEQIQEVRWVSKTDLPAICRDTYGNLKDLLASYLD